MLPIIVARVPIMAAWRSGTSDVDESACETEMLPVENIAEQSNEAEDKPDADRCSLYIPSLAPMP